MPAAATPIGRFRVGLRRLFYGHRPAAVRFQVGLLALDLAAVAYFLATTFVADAPWMRAVDLALGVLPGGFPQPYMDLRSRNFRLRRCTRSRIFSQLGGSDGRT